MQTINLEINLTIACCIIGNIQLATRHPANVGPSRQIAEKFARELEKQINLFWIL